MTRKRLDKAVVDRYEGAVAVLLVGAERRQVNVSRNHLPPDAREGSWLQVELVADSVVSAQLDTGEAEMARERVAEKLARLRQGKHLRDAP
jgi:hypothetical protein